MYFIWFNQIFIRSIMFIIRNYQNLCTPLSQKQVFLSISSKISILCDILLHKFYINVAIANILNGQINFYDSRLDPIAKNHRNLCTSWSQKPFFLAVSSKISILGDMLLHKSDINVAIANILVYQNSLYDLPEPKCKNLSNRQTLEKGVAQTALIASSTKMQWSPNVLNII